MDMTGNKLTYETALEVCNHEAIVRQAYKDVKGVWTWSVGITSQSGHKVERYVNNPQPLEHCLRIFVWALRRYAQDVREAFAGVTLTQPQFTAALSFHYNTGGIKRAQWVKSFIAGKIEAARKQFMSWKTPKSIIQRREKERDLFFDGKWSNDGTMLEYTRLNANSEPVASSAKKINIRSELSLALSDQQVPDEPAIIVDSQEHDEPLLTSKRVITWVAAAVSNAIGLLDWRVQMVSAILTAGLMAYAIYSMPSVKQKLEAKAGEVIKRL